MSVTPNSAVRTMVPRAWSIDRSIARWLIGWLIGWLIWIHPWI